MKHGPMFDAWRFRYNVCCVTGFIHLRYHPHVAYFCTNIAYVEYSFTDRKVSLDLSIHKFSFCPTWCRERAVPPQS